MKKKIEYLNKAAEWLSCEHIMQIWWNTEIDTGMWIKPNYHDLQ